MRKSGRRSTTTPSPPPVVFSNLRHASFFTSTAPRSLRSPRGSTGQHEMPEEDTAQNALRKRRGVAVAALSRRDKMTAAAVVGVSSALSSSVPVLPSSNELHTESDQQPGWKRWRSDKNRRCLDGNYQRGSRPRTEAPLDRTAPPTSSTSSAPTDTSRTLMYDLESPYLRRPRHSWQDATASPASLTGSMATPVRRNKVVLTSTPRFIQEEREAIANSGAVSFAPSVLLSTPLRLARAAQGLLSPAGATLRQRLTHLRQSSTGAAGSGQGQQRHLQAAASTASPPPPSPWGRLSSIVPVGDSLLSYADEGGESGKRASVTAAAKHRDCRASSSLVSETVALSSIPASRESSAPAPGTRRRDSRGVELPGLPRPPIQPGSLALDYDSDVEITVSLSRQSSPTATAADEVRGQSRLTRRCGERDLREMSGGSATAALYGPYNLRFAQVSSLCESLADIVSSSRSTARSSLTSAAAAAATQSRLSSVGGGSAGNVGEGCAPRRSATVMDPNLSSILPDEEELAIRRRLQRGRRCQAAHAQRSPNLHRADVTALEPARLDPVESRASAGSVMELFVARAPPFALPDRRLPREVHTEGSQRAFAFAASAPVGGAGGAPAPHGGAPAPHARDIWPPKPQQRFVSSTSPSASRRTLARASRLAVAIFSAMMCAWCVVALVSPLVALQPRYVFSAVAGLDAATAERHFVQAHANPVTDLQAMYQIAPASLSADAVVRLHHRTFSEGVERLERATHHLAPDDNAPPSQRLFYLRAMIGAYLALSRNSELYARSRDESRWRRYVSYPVADMKRYGVRRFGSFASRPSIVPSSAVAWRDRLWTTVVCSAQSEMLPCPSVFYVEEAMARDAAPFVYADVNEAHKSLKRQRKLQDWRIRLHRDWTSEIYLETLLNYIRSSVQELTRDYNR
ncbi:hypothetical protein JKF63_00174 [Porcisia hertigi]|uniref:Uncharacterized protein n=1 Tax=Porcisia hertigi TaxID=2761500 RepID=A0A836L0U6_9TRYP|nr:hypothetical protein JKF63_00174 [Porcisia hertigi]